MSKSVLTINESPEVCDFCPFAILKGWERKRNKEIYECILFGREVFEGEKGEWCPLKPMPERLDTDHCELLAELDWRTGWNACLDEIERETE